MLANLINNIAFLIALVAAGQIVVSREYANPLYRLPMTFIEIFPVGFLVSLVSAALLRNSRFLPVRRTSVDAAVRAP